MTNLNDTEPTDKSAKRKRERKAYLRHAEESWRNQLAARGITPGHQDFGSRRFSGLDESRRPAPECRGAARQAAERREHLTAPRATSSTREYRCAFKFITITIEGDTTMPINL